MNKLREALRDRQWSPSDGEIVADSTVASVAAVWFRELDEPDRAIRTKIAYRDVWTRHVTATVGPSVH